MRLPEFPKEIQKGSVSVTIRVQNARQERALAGYEQTVLSAFVDVERGLTAYAREQIRGQSLTESVQANQKALNLAEDLYAHGLTDFLRVLVSERGLYQSQDALVQSDQAVALNLVALYKALGGGWEAAGTNLNRSVTSKQQFKSRPCHLSQNDSVRVKRRSRQAAKDAKKTEFLSATATH